VSIISPQRREDDRRVTPPRAPGRVPSILDSFNWAFEGIIHVLRTQRNLRIHFAIAIAVIGMIGTVVAFIAAVLAAVAALRIGLTMSLAIAAGVGVFIASIAILAWYTYRQLISLRTELPPHFPTPAEPVGRPSS